MAPRNIIEEFFDKKTLAILKLFLYDETEEFYLREISRKTRVPVATTFRIVKRLIKLEIIKDTTIKKTKLYSLNHTRDTQYLADLLEEKKSVVEEFVDAVSEMVGVQTILQHGTESKDKTNILIIGRNIDKVAVKQEVGKIKDKYSINIIELILEQTQFEQMSSMGLFPGKKVILWDVSSGK
ncbi:MAG: hypothetical protein KKF46_03180 [Nanoarchaeota archaeon]|nr:hypothetical protein [Nanoarchaeota archaeon]MBU1321336.1 hypothetical protein [Nanoarchaeota archaeon]MBU1597259.1 hypothetical protein [Nanoarchaeota archaeon]MBU2441473.1 hypothetical protein [Nanoarchaeota archaeon]